MKTVLQCVGCRTVLWIFWGRAILTSPVAAAGSLRYQPINSTCVGCGCFGER